MEDGLNRLVYNRLITLSDVAHNWIDNEMSGKEAKRQNECMP